MKSLGFKFDWNLLVLFAGRRVRARHSLENAIIGIVDIAGLSEIRARLDVQTGLEIRRKFRATAELKAAQYGITLLNGNPRPMGECSGDGFLFHANPGAYFSARNLTHFYRDLTAEWATLIEHVNCRTAKNLQSGLRFGVAGGSVSLEEDDVHSFAAGPAVNLAARLAALAQVNGIVFSVLVWDRMEKSTPGWPVDLREHSGLNCVQQRVSAIHAGIFSKRDRAGSHLSVAQFWPA